MEKLYKTEPSPQQVQADLSEQSHSRADLMGNAGMFPARFGREAGMNNTKAQHCRMPVFTFMPPPRVVHGSRAAPTFSEPAPLGRKRQARASCSWSCSPPFSSVGEENSVKQVLGCHFLASLAVLPMPAQRSSTSFPLLRLQRENKWL